MASNTFGSEDAATAHDPYSTTEKLSVDAFAIRGLNMARVAVNAIAYMNSHAVDEMRANFRNYKLRESRYAEDMTAFSLQLPRDAQGIRNPV